MHLEVRFKRLPYLAIDHFLAVYAYVQVNDLCNSVFSSTSSSALDFSDFTV
jgi:hypothetical protein